MAILSHFTVDDLEVFGRAIRSLSDGPAGMPGAATRITGYLASNLRCEDGTPSCVAVTLHKTHRFDELPLALRDAARAADATVREGTACLTLLAADASSDAARPTTPVLPLTDAGYADRPILLSMLTAMGLDRLLIADPSMVVLTGIHRTELEAFVVPDLAASRWVPEQDRAAVRDLGIDTLLTIGGGLPTGDVFLLSIFSRTLVTDRAAWVFRALAPAVKAALIPHALHPWDE